MNVREKFSQLRKLIGREPSETSGRTRAVVKEGDPVQLKTAEESIQVDTEDETEEEDGHETSKPRRLKAKETPSIEEIKKWDTGTLIDFLQKQGLDFDFEIFHTQGITGKIFLELTKKELQSCGSKLGPAKVITELIKEIKEKKRKSSSSYHSLKEVLNKYGIEGNSIGNISQFTPEPYCIDDNDEELEQCIKEIKRKIGIMGTLLADSNEAERCEYIVVILHAAIYIARRITGKKVTISSQLEVIEKVNTGRVDFTIRETEELICVTKGKYHKIATGFAQNLAQLESLYKTNKRRSKTNESFSFDYLYGIVSTATEWYFLLYSTDKLSCTSKKPYNIVFSEAALEKDSADERELRRNVKNVMEVIVGLLIDRVNIEKSSTSKKARIEKYFKTE